MATPESIINQAAAYLSDITSEALDAADRLESLASLPYQIWIDFAKTAAISLDKVAPVTGVEDLPELRKVEMDLSMVKNFDPNMFKQSTYISPFFAFLEPKLEDFISNGGPGISTTVQQALFDNMRERDLQLVDDALALARKSYGKTGFPVPTSMLKAQENEIIKKYQDDKSNRNREITALIAERAQDTMKAAVTSGIKMEEVQSQFSLGFARLFMDVSAQLIQQYRLLQDTYIAEFDGQLKTITAKVQVGETNARLEYAFQEQLLKQWEIQTTTAIEKTKASIQQAAQATEVKLRAATGLSEFYRSMVAGIAGQANAIAIQTEDVSA